MKKVLATICGIIAGVALVCCTAEKIDGGISVGWMFTWFIIFIFALYGYQELTDDKDDEINNNNSIK